MTLSSDDFNSEVFAFANDVEQAVSCFSAQRWTIDAELASPESDRMRSVVEAKVDLPGRHDAEDAVLAELLANFKLCVDSHHTHIAVEHSSFVLKAKLDRTPIIRWDYDRDARAKPRSHVQITAHRGALSHLLSRLDRKNASRLRVCERGLKLLCLAVPDFKQCVLKNHAHTLDLEAGTEAAAPSHDGLSQC